MYTEKRFNSVHVKETVKTAEISDAFNNLRYKVMLTSFDVINDGKGMLAYEIQVVNYFFGSEPIIILDKPEYGEEPIYDYNYALSFYNDCIKKYTALVKAETRDLQDMEVYKEKINYEITCPKCCLTCKWLRKDLRKEYNHEHMLPHMHDHRFAHTYECHNPKNETEFNFELKRTRDNRYEDSGRFDMGVKYGDLGPIDDSILRIYPKVDKFGICENYEKAPIEH